MALSTLGCLVCMACPSGDSFASCIESSRVDSSVSSKVALGSCLACLWGEASAWSPSGFPCLAIAGELSSSLSESEEDDEEEEDEEDDDEDEDADRVPVLAIGCTRPRS